MKSNYFYSYFRAIKEIKKQGGKLEKDGWVVSGDLSLSYFSLYFLPIIKKASGYFSCSYNQLTTLQGSPQEVGGNFDCMRNKITTLKGVPKNIFGSFSCHSNLLTTLEEAPQEINGHFYCYNNQLTTLQGAPQKINGDFICSNNPIKDYSELDKIKIGGNIYK